VMAEPLWIKVWRRQVCQAHLGGGRAAGNQACPTSASRYSPGHLSVICLLLAADGNLCLS
jgi:hypothetical protein